MCRSLFGFPADAVSELPLNNLNPLAPVDVPASPTVPDVVKLALVSSASSDPLPLVPWKLADPSPELVRVKVTVNL
jgi:hypothetical protein